MATSKIALLEILEDLGASELKKFKWLLQQRGDLEGFQPIPKSQLENADPTDTVDKMVQTYCINTAKVTIMVLRKMNMNDQAENLSKNTIQPSGK